MESGNFRYTLDIKFDIAGGSTSLIKMHFTHLQDAFDKLLMIRGYHFQTGFAEKTFDKMTISEVVIKDNKDGKVLISSGIVPDSFDSNMKLSPGFYLRFPQSVAAFEEISNIDFSGFKGYDRDSRVLLAAARKPPDLYKQYAPLIAYENMHDQAEEKLKKSTLYGVSYTKYFFESDGNYLGALQPYPHREDFFFDSPDKALHKLLTTDFNALDERVAWENDLSSYISKAVLYRNRNDFGLDLFNMAKLHSARKNGLNIAYTGYDVIGIYLQLERDVQDKVKYPYSALENITSDPSAIYRVGLYNESFSHAERIPNLLTPFEKSNRSLASQKRKYPAKKTNGKSSKI